MNEMNERMGNGQTIWQDGLIIKETLILYPIIPQNNMCKKDTKRVIKCDQSLSIDQP